MSGQPASSNTKTDSPAPLTRVVVGAAFYVLILALPFWWGNKDRPIEAAIEAGMMALLFLSPFGPVLGAYLIWRIVRCVNDRDDPRFAKRPSEPP